MRPKSIILLVLALGCGLIASIGISEIINSKNSSHAATETEAILVAKVDVERSGVLSVDNLKLEEWPKDKIPGGAIRDLADVEGTRPMIRITAGMPILQSMLGTGEGSTRASIDIPKGYRVVGVRVNDDMGANLLAPGDRVDLQVLARRDPGLGIQRTGTWTFLQDVAVFAINAETIKTSDSLPTAARTVSLLVTPAQAAKVTLATEMGKIRLIMRGAKAEDSGEESTISIADVFGGSVEVTGDGNPIGGGNVATDPSTAGWPGGQPAADTPFAADPSFEMVVVRGADVTIEEFEDGKKLPKKVTAVDLGSGGTDLRQDDGADSTDDAQGSDSAGSDAGDVGEEQSKDN